MSDLQEQSGGDLIGAAGRVLREASRRVGAAARAFLHHRPSAGADLGPLGFDPLAGLDPAIFGACPVRSIELSSKVDHRLILPMSSEVKILPRTSAQITSRPQETFRPERIVIGGVPSDWIVNDIRIGNRSQLAQSGDLPGELFDAAALDSFLVFDTVQDGMPFLICVTYIGQDPEGAQFTCGVLGAVAA